MTARRRPVETDSSRPRVLHVGPVLDSAGRSGPALLDAWPSLAHVARATRDAGADVWVVQRSPEYGTMERDGVRYEFVPEFRAVALAGSRASRHLVFRLACRARRAQPQLVHVHGLDHPILPRMLSGVLPRVPVLVQDHSSRPPRRLRSLHRWGLGPARAFAFAAREQAAPFVAAGVIRAEARVFEVPESSSTFRPGSRTEARRECGIDGEPAVLWVGRLDEVKDPLTALDAFALACEALPHARLWCCFGEAPMLTAVRRRIDADSRLAARVRLLGQVPHDRIETLCRASDVLLHSSRREGCPYALLEAMACGLTPVLSDIPVHRRLAGDRGVYARPCDPPSFARALCLAAGRATPATRRTVRAHFDRTLSFESVGRRLVEIYRALLGAP